MGETNRSGLLDALISEAAFDTSRWADVCDGISRLVGAKGAMLYPSGPEMSAFGLPHSQSLDSAFDRYVKHGWFQRDYRFRSIGTLIRRGVATDADCISYDQIPQNEYYQELLKPEGLKWFAAIKIGNGENFWHVSIQRSAKDEPFTDQETRLALRYQEQLTNSARIAREFGFAQVRTAASLLEQQGRAVFALSWNGKMIFASPKAMALVGNSFQVTGGQLRVQNSDSREELDRLIMTVCQPGFHNGSARPIAIRRGENQLPLIVYGCTLPDMQRDIFKPAVALLVVSDPNKLAYPSASLLADYFQITTAEAKLAASLLQGISLQHHALQTGISFITARNHLQNLLRKTGAHGKAELVALLAKILPFR